MGTPLFLSPQPFRPATSLAAGLMGLVPTPAIGQDTYYLRGDATWQPISISGTGTVTSVSVVTANGVSGSVANPTTTPALTITLGAINPTSIGATTPGTGAFTTLSVTTPLSVASGGTGTSALTANNVLLGNGTGAVQFVAPSSSGNILTSNGTTWTSAAAPSGTIPSQTGHAGEFLTTNGTVSSWVPASGTGTVTSVSVVTANGVSGSVANATTTPALTLTLGAITPTSVNGLTISSSTGTLTVTNGKTLSVSNTLTLTGTDGSTLAIGAGGTLGSAAYTAATAYQASTGQTITLAGALTHAGAFSQTFTATGTTSLILPTAGTLATIAGTEAFSNKTITASAFNGTVGATTPSSGVFTSVLSPNTPAVSSTIAALKAISVTPLTTGYGVQVLGYSASGDGGGGQFYYDSSSSATDDGGTIIQPTSGSGRWLRIYGNQLSCSWFGGANNALVKAFAALPNGGTIWLAPGQNILTGTLTIPTSGANYVVRGSGTGGTFITRASSFPAGDLIFAGAGAKCSFFDFSVQNAEGFNNTSGFAFNFSGVTGGQTVVSNVEIYNGYSGVKLNGATSVLLDGVHYLQSSTQVSAGYGASMGLYVTGLSSNNTVVHCNFGTQATTSTNALVYACYVDNTDGIVISDTGFKGQFGIQLNPSGSMQLTNFYASNCVIDECLLQAVSLVGSTSGVYQNVRFDSCHMVGYNRSTETDGATISGPNLVQFIGCNISGWRGNGVVIGSGKHIILDGCDINDNDAGSGGTYDALITGGNYVSISGGVIGGLNNVPGLPSTNLVIGPSPTKVLISGVTFAADSGQPIGLSGAAPAGFSVENCLPYASTVPSLASAATIVPTYHDTINLTGSVTVSTISGGWAGRTIQFLAASGLSFTTSGNILTAVTVPANTAVVAVCDGTNWTLTGSGTGIADPGSNGMLARTALNTTTARTITGTSPISVTNGDGVSGNPTITTSMATNRLLGRTTASSGVVEELTVGAGLSLASGSITSKEIIQLACSDSTTAITAGTSKVTFRMPYAATLTDVRASVTTAPTGSTLIIDINQGGTSVLSTKLSIDATEKTSVTAATPPVISTSALTDDAEITIDFDQVGSTVAGTGVFVSLYITR